MTTTNKQQPRGLRNCNPLNIRITPEQRQGKKRWLGMCEEQADRAFCQFKSAEWGWRAAFILLTRNYYHLQRLHCVRTIVSRWAPPADGNNTEAYIRRVCELTRLLPDEDLGMPTMNPTTWMKLALAMAIVENGPAQLDYYAMLDGWELARKATDGKNVGLER